MANRGMSAAMLTEIAKGDIKPVELLELYFDAATEYYCDQQRDVDWNSNTYQGNGYYLGMGEVEESIDLIVDKVKLTISGIDQSKISQILTVNFIDRKVIVRQGFLNSSNAVIADPYIKFDGRIDSASMSDSGPGGSTTVDFTVASHWVDFGRSPGRRANHEEHQLHYPGEKGLIYASEVTKNIPWGRSS